MGSGVPCKKQVLRAEVRPVARRARFFDKPERRAYGWGWCERGIVSIGTVDRFLQLPAGGPAPDGSGTDFSGRPDRGGRRGRCGPICDSRPVRCGKSGVLVDQELRGRARRVLSRVSRGAGHLGDVGDHGLRSRWIPHLAVWPRGRALGASGPGGVGDCSGPNEAAAGVAAANGSGPGEG